MERKLDTGKKLTAMDKQDNLDELTKIDRGGNGCHPSNSQVDNMERKLVEGVGKNKGRVHENLEAYKKCLKEELAGNGCQTPFCPIELLHDCVAIIKYKGPTEGGLQLPDNCDITQPGEKLNALKGVVVGVGPGKWPDNYCDQWTEDGAMRFPMHAKPGDIVYFPDMVGIEVVISGVTYYIVHEGDILARLKPSV